MDTRLLIKHPLFPPLIIGTVSLFGICVILALRWLPQQDAELVPTRTVTPFKFLFIGTETVIPTTIPESTKLTETLLPLTRTPYVVNSATDTTPGSAEAVQNGTSAEEFFTPTVTITPNPIFDEAEPMTAGTYDGADPHIIRKGNWSNQNNAYAADGKLLVSNTVGNYVAFRFTGYLMGLGYQSSDNAGEITINIDGSELTIPQLVGNLWNSDELEQGTHYVIITHTSGSQINIDYIEIPE